MSARLFLCYAHADSAKWGSLVSAHMASLKRVLSFFYDRHIPPGAEWDQTIREEIESATIVVPIVTVSLLNSAYAMETELPRAFERQARGEVIVVPLIADYCSWQYSRLGDFQALPSCDGKIKPLVDWSNPHVPMTDVTNALHGMIVGHPTTPPMVSPPPDRPRQPMPPAAAASSTTVPTTTLPARSAEMLEVAFRSAEELLKRVADPAMWVDRLRQRIQMTVRIEADWSVRYEKRMEMTVDGAGALLAAPFKITAQPDVMANLTLFDVNASYTEVDVEHQPLMFPAFVRGPERGFAVVFSPPVTAARVRTFLAWFGVDREFAPTLGAGKSDFVSCVTSQIARDHSAELEFRLLISVKLPALDVRPEFPCTTVVGGRVAAGFGQPYLEYLFRAPAQPVAGRLPQLIRLERQTGALA